jgi:putative ABC transport system ATP-binding protein
MAEQTSHIIVQAEHLHKQVQSGDISLHILSDINLTINSGETVAIIGASGSGKTTLLGLLAGLDTPTEGRVILNGHDLSQLDEDDRAKLRLGKVGFVFQSFHLLPTLTALENVMLPLELMADPDAGKKARDVLTLVGLANRGHHYPLQLSGGEQQRIAIARAFVMQPLLLFADELTGNLDQHTGAQIVNLLFDLNAQQHTTLIIVTHDVELASRCQRCLKLVEGRVVQS